MHELDEGLRLGRHARRGLARDEPEEAQPDDAEDQRHHHGVDVDRPEAPVADRLLQEGEVVLDVLGGGS